MDQKGTESSRPGSESDYLQGRGSNRVSQGTIIL